MKVHEIYTFEQIEEAFGLIQPASHWKDPIDCWIHPSKFNICKEACMFFTGSILKQVQSMGDGAIRVKADGYYLTCGA